jgi:hypothetical protein
MTNQLYGRDLQLWIDQTIHQLQNREFGASEYPITCPFSIDQILDEDFYGI